jgi:TatD DNase family protein
LDWLEQNPVSVPLLFHCWAGNAEDAERAIRLGTWFGVDGPVTYKKADELRAVVAMLPRDRVLLETDAPYLTPHPHRGERNKPAYIPLIAEGLARVWGCSVGEVASITTTNAKRLFPAIVGTA